MNELIPLQDDYGWALTSEQLSDAERTLLLNHADGLFQALKNLPTPLSEPEAEQERQQLMKNIDELAIFFRNYQRILIVHRTLGNKPPAEE